MKKFIAVLSILLFANMAFAAPYKGDAKSARIPAGTVLKLELLQSIDTMANQSGDRCDFMLLNDQKYKNQVVLPAGSIVRGNVSKVVMAKRCSRGAVLYLDIDHIVTPTGRQLPVTVGFLGIKNINYDGGIYNSKGYGEAVQKNWDKCVDITKVCTKYGLKAGDAAPGMQYITTPFCALGGGIGGLGYLIGDTVADLFKKGENVFYNKGTIFNTRLTEPIDIPVS